MNGRRERILVGYDGSVAGERALIWAANEAGRCDGELTVCYAWTPGTPVLPDDIAAISVAHRHGERRPAPSLSSIPAEAGRCKEEAMKATVGDRLIIEGTNLNDRRRIGIIVELRHDDGTPPYVVRWLDDDHESLVFPGPTARVERPEDVLREPSVSSHN